MSASGWIGVDLDGTLAHYDGWKGDGKIGLPVLAMKRRVLDWVASGTMVKIFTARAGDPQEVLAIKAWCAKHGLPDLEVTATKDWAMIELWDDRAVRVQRNTGEPCCFVEPAQEGKP